MSFIIPGPKTTGQFEPPSRVLLYIAPSQMWGDTHRKLEEYMSTMDKRVAKYKPTLQLYSPETKFEAFFLDRTTEFDVQRKRALWIKLSEYVIARFFPHRRVSVY
jgi:hypothetical protein